MTQAVEPRQSAMDLERYCLDIACRAKMASRQVSRISGESKNRWLLQSADCLESSLQTLLKANAVDLESAEQNALTDSAIDRLRLTPERVRAMANGLREIAMLPDPVGEMIEGSTRPNGLQISKVRVPIGVIFFIYESRPNVTVDAAAIAVKSGNAIILRGGKEAIHSSTALVQILQSTAVIAGVPKDAVQFVELLDREAVGQLLRYNEYIDLAIPRGGESLIRRVVSEATMPVLKHYDGNCHVYVDRDADLEKSLDIVENAKCQRMGVCNALESLLVHESVATRFLPGLVQKLKPFGIELRGDLETRKIIPTAVAATEEDWSREYLGPVLSVKIVADVQEAIDHINRFGSHHTDAIMTNSLESARRFVDQVDSAAVMVNASTRFNDGSQLGLGAEIGISTDKFHARGPCGLRELTTYKYVVYGDGHVRG